jgi:hypothetical protein
MSKWLLGIILSILIFIGGYFVGINTYEPPAPVVITETDTLYVPSEPVVIWKTATITKTIHDTTIITDNDTIYIESGITVARTDTIFNEGRLGIQYFYPPVGRFNLDWRPFPQKIIIQTVVEYKDREERWWERKEYWLVGGVIIGAIVRGQ